MNYEYLWKVLEELISELMKREVTVPQELVDDLKSVKTLINIYNVDSTAHNFVTEIEVNIEKIEANILFLIESEMGKEYANECLSRIYNARKKGVSEKATFASRFVSGVPKGEYWIRIKVSDLISNRDMDELLEKFSLISKPQKNGYRLIYGNEANVKTFIKEIGKKNREKR